MAPTGTGPFRDVLKDVSMGEPLCREIGSEPVTKVAEAWGPSDHGLRKKCREMKIPLPGRGYWPKVRAG